MNSTILELSSGSQASLSAPSAMRDYINERGEGRTFHIESVNVHKTPEPHKIAIDLHIAPTGAEQLDPFTVSLVLGESAASQLAEKLKIGVAPGLEQAP